MKLQVQQFMFSVSILLLLVSFIGVKSSNDNFISNRIARGSSISPKGTSYWLSDSGNIAFGFYPLLCTSSSTTSCTDQYVVGIWFINSPHKTLVWTANRDDPPLSNLYSLIITEEGNLVLRADNKLDKPLIDVHRHIQPVSYAKMHDNGNFVLYNSESQIIWESFDYPTDTILGGQILKDDVDLVSSGSGEYKLSINPGVGGFTIFRPGKQFTFMIPYGDGLTSSNCPMSLNLDTSGDLYFSGTYESTLYEHQRQRQQGDNIYRATLDSEGNFNLYQERIDGNISDNDDNSSVLVQLWSSYDSIYPSDTFRRFSYGLFSFIMYPRITEIIEKRRGVVEELRHAVEEALADIKETLAIYSNVGVFVTLQVQWKLSL